MYMCMCVYVCKCIVCKWNNLTRKSVYTLIYEPHNFKNIGIFQWHIRCSCFRHTYVCTYILRTKDFSCSGVWLLCVPGHSGVRVLGWWCCYQDNSPGITWPPERLPSHSLMMTNWWLWDVFINKVNLQRNLILAKPYSSSFLADIISSIYCSSEIFVTTWGWWWRVHHVMPSFNVISNPTYRCVTGWTPSTAWSGPGWNLLMLQSIILEVHNQ